MDSSPGPLLTAPRDDVFAHQALLFGSAEEFVEVVAPFLRDGVRADDAVIVVSEPARITAVQQALTPAEAAAVAFQPTAERYQRVGHALAGYHRLLDTHVRAGRRVRAVSEPPLAMLDEQQVHDLFLQDAAFNEVCSIPGVSMVCSYDGRTTPPAVVEAIRRSHPEVVEHGARRASPTYTDPLRLITEDRYGPPLPAPEGRVHECSSPRDPAEVRAFLAPIAEQAGLDEPVFSDVVTAVNEIVTNAFTHAVIDTVRVWDEPDRLVCEVRDDGVGLTDLFAGFRQPDGQQTNGWGLWLARQLTDLVEVRTGGEGTTIRCHVARDGL